MLLGTNIEHAKSLNRRVVLEAVRRGGPTTRADVARITGLTPQAVSNISAELVEAGLIREGERRRGRRGQPAAELSIDPCGGYAVGLNLGHQTLTGVLVDLTGAALAFEGRALPRADAPIELLVGEMADLVETLMRRHGLPRERLWGVGCGLPGLVRDGIFTVETFVADTPTINYPLAQVLSRRLGLPVIAENDARAAAIGERLHGIGRQIQHFLYIHFGFGTGGGVVVAGQHYRGGSGGAGEIGHMIVKPGGRPCACGNRGCLEQYVSVFAAVEAVCGPDLAPDALLVEELGRRHAAGDARLTAWIDHAAQYLRIAIHNIEVMFDPETVVIGGDLPEGIQEALIERTLPLLPSVYPDARPRLPRLMRAEAQDMPALGAAALPIAAMVQPSLDLLWKARGGDGSRLTQAQAVLGRPITASR